MQQLLTAAGATLLAGGLAASNGLYNAGALLLVTLAAGASGWAAALGSPWRASPSTHPPTLPRDESAPPTPGPRAIRFVLLLALLGGVASHVLFAPGRLQPSHPLAFRLLAVAGTTLAATFLAPSLPTLARLRFPLLLGVFAAMGAVAIAASPDPFIDVWHFRQQAAQALWQGKNPYAIDYPNIYGDTPFLSRAFLSGTRVTAYPYPPLIVLLDLPAWLLFGDVRYLSLAAMLLGAWAVRRLSAGRVGELSALALLFQSRTFLVLVNAWTEPVVLAAWALALLAGLRFLARARSGTAVAGLAAAVLAASKQYSPLLLVPLALAIPRAGLLAAVAWAAGGLSALLLPFVAWSPAGFWRGVVVMQFLQPFRMDALSWLVWWARLFGQRLSTLPAFALSTMTLAATLPLSSTLQQAAVAAPAALLVFFLFNKQAFCNYYWLASCLLFCACAILERQDPRKS